MKNKYGKPYHGSTGYLPFIWCQIATNRYWRHLPTGRVPCSVDQSGELGLVSYLIIIRSLATADKERISVWKPGTQVHRSRQASFSLVFLLPIVLNPFWAQQSFSGCSVNDPNWHYTRPPIYISEIRITIKQDCYTYCWCRCSQVFRSPVTARPYSRSISLSCLSFNVP